MDRFIPRIKSLGYHPEKAYYMFAGCSMSYSEWLAAWSQSCSA